MGRGNLLSTLSMYNYDNTLFDEFVIPSVLDREDLIMRILLETAELEVWLTDFDTYKTAIGFWSRLLLEKWNHMADVLFVDDYNPFENINRTELKTYNLANTDNNTRTYDLDTTDNNTRTLGNTTTETKNLTTTDQIQSFDSGTWQNREKQDQTGTDTWANTGTITDRGDGSTEGDVTDMGTGSKTGTVKTENYGLSTYYSAPDSKIRIIESEVELRSKYDLESIILEDFKKEFCLMVY